MNYTDYLLGRLVFGDGAGNSGGGSGGTAIVLADGTFDSGATWKLNSNGVFIVSGEGAMDDYTAESEQPWYDYETTITHVSLGNSVTNIGSYAFYGCSNLKNITIPSTLESVGSYAFYGCSNLKNITLPNNLTTIGSYAFYNCSSLTDITIPDTVTSINSSTFRGCTSFTTITVPDGVTSVGSYAFYGCSNVATIIVPSSVTSTGAYAFASCKNIESAYYNGTLEQWLGITFGAAGTPCASGAALYIDGELIEDLVVPDSVTKISNLYCFYGCTSLKTLTVPDHVTFVNTAFERCTSLTTVNLGSGTEVVRSSTFSGCSKLTTVNFSSNITSILDEAFKDCSSLTTITIPAKVATIHNNAFSGTALTSATFEDTTTWKVYTDLPIFGGSLVATLSSSDLAKTSTAATYLKTTYCNNYWQKT